MKKLLTLFIVLLAVVSGPVFAESISVNFLQDAGEAFAGGALIGPLATDSTNWNEGTGAAGTLTGLVDDSGTPTGVDITWFSKNTWGNNDGNADDEHKLAEGYLDDGAAASGPVVLTITNIPYSTYKVYGLFATDQNQSTGGSCGILNFDVNGTWALGGDAATTASAYGIIEGNNTANGQYWTEIDPGVVQGNYWTVETSGATCTITGNIRSGENRGCVTGVIIENLISTTATDPIPDDGVEVDSTTTTQLEWSDPDPEAYVPVGYDLVFRAATEAIEPNFLALDNIIEITDQSAVSPQAVTLDYGTTYYWRVDAYEPNLVGSQIPTRHEGAVWSFTTAAHPSTLEDSIVPALGIAITNPSFESVEDGGTPGDWGYVIDDWYENENPAATDCFWEKGTAIGLSGDGDIWVGAEDGDNVDLTDGGRFYQPIGTFAAADTYTIAMLLGSRVSYGGFDTGVINLYAGGDESSVADGNDLTAWIPGVTLLDTTTVTTADGPEVSTNVYEVTVQLSTAGASPGDLLWLEFGSVVGKDYFDNIRMGYPRADNSAWGGANDAIDPQQPIVLTWQQGVDPANNYAPDPAITGYKVYRGTDTAALALEETIVGTGAESHTIAALTLPGLTPVYWRVDETTAGADITGPLWSFTTGPSDPILLTDPASVTEATEASFTVTADATVTSLYQWTHNSYTLAVVADGATLTDGDYYVDNTTSGVSTLTISNLSTEDDEGTVSCEISNAHSAVKIKSADARLMTERLVAHWKLDGDLTAIISKTGENWNGDYIDPNDDTPIPPVVYTTGADGLAEHAVKFNGYNLVEVPDSNEFFDFHPQGLTLTAWVLEAPTGNSGNWQRPFNKGSYAIAQQDPNQIIAIIDGADWTTAVPAAEASEGKWRFVAVTYGGSNDPNRTTYGIYDDDNVIDVLHSGVVTQTGTHTSGINVLIGGAQASSPDPAYNYEGSVDDVRVYNYALTASQIQGVYADMLPTTPLCTEFPEMDTTGPDGFPDCKVDLYEFAEIASAWLDCGRTPVVPYCD